jgi:tetratricopeptide (TPR) repeat protein
MVMAHSTNNRREIEEKLKNLGDYVKIDYLARCLRESPDFDTRKFILTNLSKLYELKGMNAEAARNIMAAADINTTYEAKIVDFMKAAELFMKANAFADADVAVTKAIATGNTKQKAQVKAQQKVMYTTQAKALMQRDKRREAMQAYEKVASLELTPQEKTEVNTILLGLYEKLGKVREFYNLKRGM